MTDTAKILPKLRFPEFENDGEWKVVKLGEIFKRITDKNKENNNNVLTISAQDGLVSQYDYFNKNVAANDVTGYYLIKTGDFAYNKSRSQGYPYGAIKPLKLYDKGVVSTLYICFRTKEQNSCIDFYEHYFETDLIHNEIGKIAQEGARNHGLLNISTEDFFEKISLFIPSLPEQQKIATFLTSLDEQISAHTKKLEALKAHKKGLMQQLFPANGEKTPKLRFPEFKNAGEWEEDSMQNIFEIKNGYTPSKANAEYWTNGTIPWFRMEDIRTNGHILSDSIQHITPQAVKNGYLFPAFSIILATTATIGEHALIIVDSLANQRFTFLSKCKSYENKLDMMYFHYYMFIIDEWCKQNTNAGGLLSVNMPAFKQLKVPIPPSPEQQKIASFLTSIDEMIHAQDDKIRKLKTYKDGLMQQLFAK